jgi:hypothetical protein
VGPFGISIYRCCECLVPRHDPQYEGKEERKEVKKEGRKEGKRGKKRGEKRGKKKKYKNIRFIICAKDFEEKKHAPTPGLS